MILLDTNVVSELMRNSPSDHVLDWLDSQASETLFLSTVTLAEISYGLKCLPQGKHSQSLNTRFKQFIKQAFEQRIISFDREAAYCYGELMAYRKRVGRPMSSLDGQIAAVAQANTMVLATRNIKDFNSLDLEIINPFS